MMGLGGEGRAHDGVAPRGPVTVVGWPAQRSQCGARGPTTAKAARAIGVAAVSAIQSPRPKPDALAARSTRTSTALTTTAVHRAVTASIQLLAASVPVPRVCT